MFWVNTIKPTVKIAFNLASEIICSEKRKPNIREQTELLRIMQTLKRTKAKNKSHLFR